MKLKSIALLFVGTLSTLALVVSLALITITNALHHSSANLLSSTQSIVAVEELETSLHVHSRESLLWTITGDAVHLANRHKAREDLTKWFEESHLHIGSEDEGTLIKIAEDAVNQYFDVQNQLEKSNASLNDIATGIADEADEAIRRLQQVTDLNLEQSKELIRQSKRTDSLATLMGAVVVVLVLVSIPTIIWLLRRMIYRPVLEIANSLRSFRKHRVAGQPTSGAVELKAISTELSDMTSELTKQSQTQIRYLSAVAHDLRNPIAAIIMSTDLTLVEYGSEIPDDAKELLELIQRQSVHLERMVSDLLDTTRAESGDLELKKSLCDLNSLIKGCVDLFSCYSRSHTVVFECGTSLLLEIDPTRLTQVMNNLISNAIKYSPYGGQITVSVLQGRTEAVVSVRDSGIGISVEDQETIFEPFRRASATKDTIPGVGLGLFTAKKIVMAHGGTIEVHSRVREGSTFEVHLPLSQRAHGSATPFDVKLTAAQETSDRRSHGHLPGIRADQATLDSRTENLL